MLAMTLRRRNHFHLLPVIGKFSAAIEASNVGPGQSRRLGTALCSANGYGKAVARVSAAEQCIHQFFDHNPPSIPERVCRAWVLQRVRAPLHIDCASLSLNYLDSFITKRVEVF